jgi:hypothetical protein
MSLKQAFAECFPAALPPATEFVISEIEFVILIARAAAFIL